MMKIKLGVSLILAFLVFVFITQNTETVQVKFLFWSLEMSLVLMVFILFVAGVITGWLVSSYLRYAGHRKPAAPPAKTAAGSSPRPAGQSGGERQESGQDKQP